MNGMQAHTEMRSFMRYRHSAQRVNPAMAERRVLILCVRRSEGGTA